MKILNIIKQFNKNNIKNILQCKKQILFATSIILLSSFSYQLANADDSTGNTQEYITKTTNIPANNSNTLIGVAKLLLYPMQQFVEVIHYTFDTRPRNDLINMQSRFIKLSYLDQQSAIDYKKNLKDLYIIFKSKSQDRNKKLASFPNEICQENQSYSWQKNKKNQECYKIVDSNNLLAILQYKNEQQQQAAYDNLQLLLGLSALKTPDKSWDKKKQKVQEYKAFYKSMQAMNSIAAYPLIVSYTLRKSNNNNSSDMYLSNKILTGDASSPKFWSDINKIPVIGQLTVIANYMPAIALGIERGNRYLEMISTEMATLLKVQLYFVGEFQGKQLYQAASMDPDKMKKNMDAQINEATQR